MKTNLLIISIILTLSINTYSQDKLSGVYSNNSDGFKTVTMIIDESGYGYLMGGMTGIMGEWKFTDETKLNFTYFDYRKEQDLKLNFTYNKEKKFLQQLNDSGVHSKLYLTKKEIPKQYKEKLKNYPNLLKQMKERIRLSKERKKLLIIKFKEKRKREAQEKLKIEKEYERISERIKKNPTNISVTDFDFSSTSSTSLLAFKKVLANHKIKFEEDTLVYLINNLPKNGRSLISTIAYRPELSSETLTNLKNKIIEWNNYNSYAVFSYIRNPKIPISVIQNIADSKDIPGGITATAKSRLKEIKEEPELLKIINSIKNSPDQLLIKNFDLSKKYNLSSRALSKILRDPDIKLSEKTLIDFVNDLPEKNAEIMRDIIKRPELSSDSLQEIYPKGKKMSKYNTYILTDFIRNKNTPIPVIKDIEKNKNARPELIAEAQLIIEELENK